VIILNLGCGTKTCNDATVINIDWSIYLRIKRNALLRVIAPYVIKGERLDRFRKLPSNVMVHDLSKGIPFPNNSVDVVYHSHVLEHLDRDVARTFLVEIHRVLRPGGIVRVVVPDFERYAKEYVDHLLECDRNAREIVNHEEFISRMILQSVRREAYGTSQQRPLRRWVENKLLGDARARGETHQWAYDRITCPALLYELGYSKVTICSYDTSEIVGWNRLGLDCGSDGEEYKPESLYVEAFK
jgi:predicted SAM-dependent methyltransferase